MRLNPLALALAFGVAKLAVTVLTTLGIAVWQQITMGSGYGGHPFSLFSAMGWPFLTLQVVMSFVGGAIAGALAAVVYNKVIARRAQAA